MVRSELLIRIFKTLESYQRVYGPSWTKSLVKYKRAWLISFEGDKGVLSAHHMLAKKIAGLQSFGGF